jgi:hypothetical protein
MKTILGISLAIGAALTLARPAAAATWYESPTGTATMD